MSVKITLSAQIEKRPKACWRLSGYQLKKMCKILINTLQPTYQGIEAKITSQMFKKLILMNKTIRQPPFEDEFGFYPRLLFHYPTITLFLI